MGDQYTVKAGDNLSKIAQEHGYPSWRVIYNHPKNAAFRRLRPNPNLIKPGDVVILPDAPSSPAPAVINLPWHFADRFQIPDRLWLDPAPLIRPQLFPTQLPPYTSSPPSSSLPPPRITLGGWIQDTPLTLTGEPITGGYGDGLKWAGKAALKYPFIQQRLGAAKNWATNLAWTSAPPWRKGLEVGVLITGAATLLWFEPSREFIRDKVHGQDIPLDLIGLNWLSIQPRLGIKGDWGGVLTFDLQNIVNPPKPKSKR